jgi:Flp pilus assembly pilin Flp
MTLVGRQIEISSWLRKLLRDEDGQSVTEYAVVMAVITLIALASISVAGVQTLDVLRRVATNLH